MPTYVACVELSGLYPPRKWHKIYFRWKFPTCLVQYDIHYSHFFKITSCALQLCNVTENLIPLHFNSNVLVRVVYIILHTGSATSNVRNNIMQMMGSPDGLLRKLCLPLGIRRILWIDLLPVWKNFPMS